VTVNPLKPLFPSNPISLRDAENAGVEFAAINGHGKRLQKLKSTQRRYTTQYGDRLHSSAFDGENVKAAEQFTVAQREVE